MCIRDRLSTALLGSASVWAETADDVDCSGCVQGDEIAKQTVTQKNIAKDSIGEAKIKNGAVTMSKLSDEVLDAINNASPAQTGAYVGFSSSTVTADVGFAGMAQACQADFGLSSRMASSAEIVGLTSFPADAGQAWVRSSGDRDPSGIAGVNNCQGFSDSRSGQYTSARALIVNGENYSFEYLSCQFRLFVACSVVQ